MRTCAQRSPDASWWFLLRLTRSILKILMSRAGHRRGWYVLHKLKARARGLQGRVNMPSVRRLHGQGCAYHVEMTRNEKAGPKGQVGEHDVIVGRAALKRDSESSG